MVLVIIVVVAWIAPTIHLLFLRWRSERKLGFLIVVKVFMFWWILAAVIGVPLTAYLKNLEAGL
jgi:hypothetical protein